jgi:hypothetical protein
MKKYRTYAEARFEILEPTEERRARASAAVADSAVAVSQKDLLSYALENKQDDLLYFKAVYATCGFNLNDDVFVNDEFWQARGTPVLKPTNWQHVDKDIIGVIYAVEAQYLDGTPIDVESENIPEEDFELVVYGVIYKYTFAERAAEIEKRSEEGELFVSMETWFDDFAYALLDEEKSEMQVVERNSSTAALDKYLRCAGGVGVYNGKRIGRVLKGMTFGGMGIVDQPANPRSGGVVHASEDGTENNQIDLEINLMPEEIREAVKAELAEVAKVEAHEKAIAEVAELTKQNATAAENLERAAEKAQRTEEGLAVAEGILAALGTKLDSALASIGDDENVVPEDTSLEDKLDLVLADSNKDDGEELTALKAELDELRAFKAGIEEAKAEAEKAERTEARTAEIKELLGEDAEEELLESVVAKVVDLDDEAYAEKLDEWKVFAAKARPELMHDGGQGSPDEEGATGESKAKSGPREDHKVSASLEDAEVEEHLEPTEETQDAPELGLAKLLLKNKKN